jgi:type II restriction enzyme
MSTLDSQFLQALSNFLKEKGDSAITKISDFMNSFRNHYEKVKCQEFLQKGCDYAEAQNKARNSWVVFSGKKLEEVIFTFLEEYCKKNNIYMVRGSALGRCCDNEMLSKVRRKIEVAFEKYSLLPDADVVVYKLLKGEPEVLAILSVKNSFRERYTETPYWKLKLLQDKVTQKIKVFMLTPDNDDEISTMRNGPKKARIILEYELDSIYLLKERFESSPKVKSIKELFKDLDALINECGKP